MELFLNLSWRLLLGLIAWVLIFLGLTYYLIRQNRTQLKSLFDAKLTYAPINFTQAPRMNRGFFDENTAYFMQLDFTPIGDFTIPQFPTENYHRALYHSPYHTYALMSQMRVKGFWSYLTRNLPPWFDFITNFEDGTSLTTTTSTTADVAARPPQALLQKGVGSFPPEVFNQHVKMLNDLMNEGKKPLPVSLEGFFAAFQEGFRQQGEFRKKHGYLSPLEVQTIARQSGKPLEGKIMSWVVGKMDRG